MARISDIMSENKEKTLAEKCFDALRDDLELYDAVNMALGAQKRDYSRYYIFYCCVDPYDKSVELFFSLDSPKLDRESANKILDLGFGVIYASYGPEEGDGESWTRLYGPSKCSPRYDGEGDNDKLLILKYREQLDKAKSYLKSVSKMANAEHWSESDVQDLIIDGENLYKELFK